MPEPLLIRSAQNAKFKQLCRWYQDARARRQDGLVVLEGEHLLTELQQHKQQPERLVFSETTDPASMVRWTVAWPNVPVWILERALYAELSDLPSGYPPMAVWAPSASAEIPQDVDVLLLEGIQDPGNLGTILRTAAAVGLRHVLLSADCTDVWSPKCLRAGMGGQLRLSILQGVDLSAWLAQNERPVYATLLNDRVKSIYQQDLHAPACWLFGSEGSGLSVHLASRATQTLFIPMPGGTESLNVASAVAVCLYEQLRQRDAVV